MKCISQTYRFCIEVSFVSAVLLQMRLPWSCQYHLVYCSMKIYLAPFLLDILCSWTCNQPTSTSKVIESWVRSLNSSIMLMKKLINFFFLFWGKLRFSTTSIIVEEKSLMICPSFIQRFSKSLLRVWSFMARCFEIHLATCPKHSFGIKIIIN